MARARQLQLPLYLTLVLVAFMVAGKAGDILAPTLLVDAPLTLLILNSNDLHLALTCNSVKRLPWLLVGTLRRLAEDPVCFLIGFWYGEDAMRWLTNRSPDLSNKVAKAQNLFRRASYLAVVFEPGMVICFIAGASKMSLVLFFTLNILGTFARLALIRALGEQFPAQIELLLQVIEGYKPFFLLSTFTVTMSITLASSSSFTPNLNLNIMGLIWPTLQSAEANAHRSQIMQKQKQK